MQSGPSLPVLAFIQFQAQGAQTYLMPEQPPTRHLLGVVCSSTKINGASQLWTAGF